MQKRGVIANFILLAIAAIIIGVVIAYSLANAPRPKTITAEPPESRTLEIESVPIAEMPPIIKNVNPKVDAKKNISITKPQQNQTISSTPSITKIEPEKPPDPRITLTDSLPNQQIDIEAIVLVKCHFESQYFKTSYQPWDEERYSLGSGVIISPAGYILTAKHIFDLDDEMKNDISDRIWRRIDCAAAQTDIDQTPIHPTNPNDSSSDPEFKNLEIIFEPSEKEYNNANDLDFLIAKANGLRTHSHGLESHLIEFEKEDKITAIGYPGKVVSVPQKLERWDGKFQTLASLEGSTCSGEIEPCGLRYLSTRLLKEYQDLFYKESRLGIYSPYFRGGFSGAPAFYNGNLIGIITHGESGEKNPEERDEVLILTSFDITETLKKYDVSF